MHICYAFTHVIYKVLLDKCVKTKLHFFGRWIWEYVIIPNNTVKLLSILSKLSLNIVTKNKRLLTVFFLVPQCYSMLLPKIIYIAEYVPIACSFIPNRKLCELLTLYTWDRVMQKWPLALPWGINSDDLEAKSAVFNTSLNLPCKTTPQKSHVVLLIDRSSVI